MHLFYSFVGLYVKEQTGNNRNSNYIKLFDSLTIYHLITMRHEECRCYALKLIFFNLNFPCNGHILSQQVGILQLISVTSI